MVLKTIELEETKNKAKNELINFEGLADNLVRTEHIRPRLLFSKEEDQRERNLEEEVHKSHLD
jgi:hypothetical protein